MKKNFFILCFFTLISSNFSLKADAWDQGYRDIVTDGDEENREEPPSLNSRKPATQRKKTAHNRLLKAAKRVNESNMLTCLRFQDALERHFVGSRYPRIHSQLYRENPATLDKAAKICRIHNLRDVIVHGQPIKNSQNTPPTESSTIKENRDPTGDTAEEREFYFYNLKTSQNTPSTNASTVRRNIEPTIDTGEEREFYFYDPSN